MYVVHTGNGLSSGSGFVAFTVVGLPATQINGAVAGGDDTADRPFDTGTDTAATVAIADGGGNNGIAVIDGTTFAVGDAAQLLVAVGDC